MVKINVDRYELYCVVRTCKPHMCSHQWGVIGVIITVRAERNLGGDSRWGREEECERERDREGVCVRERVRVSVRERECVCVKEKRHVNMHRMYVQTDRQTDGHHSLFFSYLLTTALCMGIEHFKDQSLYISLALNNSNQHLYVHSYKSVRKLKERWVFELEWWMYMQQCMLAILISIILHCPVLYLCIPSL